VVRFLLVPQHYIKALNYLCSSVPAPKRFQLQRTKQAVECSNDGQASLLCCSHLLVDNEDGDAWKGIGDIMGKAGTLEVLAAEFTRLIISFPMHNFSRKSFHILKCAKYF
jgi:hypothetical protein